MSENLMLEILKNLQAGQSRIEHVLRENTARLAEMDDRLRHLAAGQVLGEERMARMESRIDALRWDLDRVNVRLGLVE